MITSYNKTAHNILDREINLMLPQIQRKQKCGIITTLVSSLLGLAYEGISSFLHHKQNMGLHQAVRAMDSKNYYPAQQIDAIRKFNVNIWHLQCRNIGKAH